MSIHGDEQPCKDAEGERAAGGGKPAKPAPPSPRAMKRRVLSRSLVLPPAGRRSPFAATVRLRTALQRQIASMPNGSGSSAERYLASILEKEIIPLLARGGAARQFPNMTLRRRNVRFRVVTTALLGGALRFRLETIREEKH